MTDIVSVRQAWQQTIRGEGGHCPCCDRWGKMYRRGINGTMASSVVWLAWHAGNWVDVPRVAPRFVVASNQLPTMRWWELVERCAPLNNEDKRFSGWWRVTAKGAEWAANRIAVPKYVWTYNDTVYDTEGPAVTVRDCLGERFSYDDVMSTMMNRPVPE